MVSRALFVALICGLSSLCFAQKADSFSEEKPKTLLILSSKGGYGHAAAVNTLEKILGKGYQVNVVHPIDEMLRSSGINLGEKIYDIMLKNRWIRSLNFLARSVAPHFFRNKYQKLEKIVAKHIHSYQPDLVISVIPFINYPASEAARLEDVPYLLITTDNDLSNWAEGLEKIKHPDFMVTIGADLPSTRTILVNKRISEAAIQTIGLPLRPEFINYKQGKDLKSKYHIVDGKPVVLVMMGGSGSQSAYDFAAELGARDLHTHLIVCTGKHEGLKRSLEGLSLDPSNSMTVMGFTDKIADLMAVSDLLVTKPGPGTINEAIAMQLPVIVDNTETPLFWERANTEMVKHFGVGQGVGDIKRLPELVVDYLTNPEEQERVHRSFASIPPNQFHQKIKTIIDDMIQGSHSVLMTSCVNQDFNEQSSL